MTLDEVPRVSRKSRSRKRRKSRQTRRVTKAIGWSLLALATTAIFVTGVIYLVLSMRGEGSGMPVVDPNRPIYSS